MTKKVGTTWEDYYRFDPEQTPAGNVIPLVSKILFRVSGDAHPANQGNGFLVDSLSLSSSNLPSSNGRRGPTNHK